MLRNINQTFRKLLKKQNSGDNDRFIMSADKKNKRIWQLINEGTCTSHNKNNNITITNG